ncbi:MAG: acyltransferase [Thermoleophilia bacterium]
MTPYLSKKLAVMRFLAVVAIIWFHAYFATYGGSGTGAFLPTDLFARPFLPRFWSLAVMRWGMPFLGGLSGYLFFRSLSPSVAAFSAKYRRRFWSLLVPFLIWSALGLLYVVAAQTLDFGRAPEAESVRSIGAGLRMWLVQPAMGQLWFLQSLMGCVLVAPIIYVCVSSTRGWVLVAGLVWWVSGWPSSSQLLWMSPTVFFPFIVGAAFSILRWRAPRLPRWLVPLLLPLWLCACALYALLGSGHGYGARAGLLGVVALGVPAVWFGFDLAAARARRWRALSAAASSVSTYSFFLYLCQFPLLSLLAHRALPYSGDDQWVRLLQYVVVWALTVAASVGAAVAMRRRLPRAYALMTGGRHAPRTGHPLPGAAVIEPAEP